MNKMWKTTEIKQLRKLIAAGNSHRDIGLKLGRTRETVSGKCCQLKLKSQYKGKGGISLNKPGITYLVYFPKIDIYKVGVTGVGTKERNNQQVLDYQIILERYFDTCGDAFILEQKWLENIQEYKINTGKLNTGNTETFRL